MNSPITHMNCLGINFPIARTSVTQKKRFRIICVISSGRIVAINREVTPKTPTKLGTPPPPSQESPKVLESQKILRSLKISEKNSRAKTKRQNRFRIVHAFLHTFSEFFPQGFPLQNKGF